jgi:hypothetical protein
MQSIARVCILGAAKPQQRRVKLQLSQRRRMATGAPDPATIKPNMNVMKIGVQTIFAGTEALEPFVAELKTYSRRPLIVTDEGIAKVGLVQQFVDALKKAGLQPTVFGMLHFFSNGFLFGVVARCCCFFGPPTLFTRTCHIYLNLLLVWIFWMEFSLPL